MNKQINGDTEIAEAKRILDEAGIPANTYWYQAIVGNEFGSFEHVDKAGDWTTCACGERDKRIIWILSDELPFDDLPPGEVVPGDFELRQLGIAFPYNFDRSAAGFGRIRAAQTLVAIEKRVQQLEEVGSE